MKSKISREKKTIETMISIYCKDIHKSEEMLCEDCKKLLEYAFMRLDICPFKDNKPACAKCTVHCYKDDMRKKIREVMKYSGPRMVLRHPVLTILHYIQART
jgi:hypothetical protein